MVAKTAKSSKARLEQCLQTVPKRNLYSYQMNKVLWFSRHTLTEEQRAALGNVEVTQIDGNMPNVHVPFDGRVNGEQANLPAFKELIQDFDVVAVVLPINLETQVLKVAGDKPVIRSVNERVLIPQADGSESKVEFRFGGWQRLVKIEVVLEDFPPCA